MKTKKFFIIGVAEKEPCLSLIIDSSASKMELIINTTPQRLFTWEIK